MAGSVNKAILIGNLGGDPDVKTGNTGIQVGSFSIATSESWRDKQTGERKERTQWHRIIVFSEGLIKVAEQYLKKGSKVYVEGQIETRKWTDQGGIERYVTEIVVRQFNGSITLLDKRAGGVPGNDGSDEDQRRPGSGARASSPRTGPGSDMDDDIPF